MATMAFYHLAVKTYYLETFFVIPKSQDVVKTAEILGSCDCNHSQKCQNHITTFPWLAQLIFKQTMPSNYKHRMLHTKV